MIQGKEMLNGGTATDLYRHFRPPGLSLTMSSVIATAVDSTRSQMTYAIVIVLAHVVMEYGRLLESADDMVQSGV